MEPSVDTHNHGSLFGSRRRLHLRSGTYCSMIRIWSNFHGDPQVFSTPNVLQELTRQDNGKDETTQTSEKETHAAGEAVGIERTQPDIMLNVVQVEPLNVKQAWVQIPTGSSLREDASGAAVGIERTQPDIMLNTVEVEPLNGKEETHDSGEVVGIERKQLDIILSSIEAELLNEKGLTHESGEAEQTELDFMLNVVQGEPVNEKQVCMQMPSGFHLLEGESGEVVDIELIQPDNLVNAVQGRMMDEKQACLQMPSGSSLLENESGEAVHTERAQPDNMLNVLQVHTKDENQICSQMPSLSRLLEDEDFEEGEISGDMDIDCNLIDMCLKDSVQVETVEERQVHKDIIERRDVPSCLVCPNLGQNSENVDTTGSKHQEFQSKEKSDVDSFRKENRTISERSKEKKKQKKRKKRAEKNRMLGVERLKLKTVVKPKPVNYCSHYLKGRCHEGEKCKFSHDTIPLTKSTPCCYFARQSCLKGDDCPFDHDLSKHPCDNFTTKGFCNRGDACLFSHKDIVQSGMATQKTDPAPMNLGLSNTKEKQNMNSSSYQNAGAKSFSFGVSPKIVDKQSIGKTLNQTSRIARSMTENTTEIPAKKPSAVPKGISFLSFGQTSMVGPDISKEPACLEMDKVVRSSAKAEIPMKALHQASAERSDETQNRNHASVVVPKGISFVSPGRGSRVCLNPLGASDKHQSPTAKQFELSPSSDGHSKSTAKSTQKTLMSALRFAAAFESSKTIKPSVDQVAAGNNETKRTGTLGGANASNPSKILEFLSKLQQ